MTPQIPKPRVLVSRAIFPEVLAQLEALFEPPPAPAVPATVPGGEPIADTIGIDDQAASDRPWRKLVGLPLILPASM